MLQDPVGTQEGVDVDMGESFFGAAQRRLGLLSNSLIAVQCQYLAGLYEKFLVRPLAAWSLFQSASSQFQAYLYAKGLAVASQGEFQEGKRARHIEQRLYWSCVKAEWYVCPPHPCSTSTMFLNKFRLRSSIFAASSELKCNFRHLDFYGSNIPIPSDPSPSRPAQHCSISRHRLSH